MSLSKLLIWESATVHDVDRGVTGFTGPGAFYLEEGGVRFTDKARLIAPLPFKEGSDFEPALADLFDQASRFAGTFLARPDASLEARLERLVSTFDVGLTTSQPIHAILATPAAQAMLPKMKTPIYSLPKGDDPILIAMGAPEFWGRFIQQGDRVGAAICAPTYLHRIRLEPNLPNPAPHLKTSSKLMNELNRWVRLPPERRVNELHIYGQLFYHGEAWICGNRAALHALRDTIDRALATNGPTSSHHLTRDGEGYATIVVPVSTTDTLQLPYSWSETMEDRVGTHPFETVSRERYRALMSLR